MNHKQVNVVTAELLLRQYVSNLDTLTAMRDFATSRFGCAAGANRYPLSGGVCAHWPEPVKNVIVNANHNNQNLLEESLTCWRAAGKHASTWRRLKEDVVMCPEL